MEIVNKKILGTKQIVIDDITFKSTLEASCYRMLKESGLTFLHESEKVVLCESVKPLNITIYTPSILKDAEVKYRNVRCKSDKTKVIQIARVKRGLTLQTRKLLGITYTPDFLVMKDNFRIYLDIKGFANDTYPLKLKLFLNMLEKRNDGFRYVFIEPHSLEQMGKAIEIINNL